MNANVFPSEVTCVNFTLNRNETRRKTPRWLKYFCIMAQKLSFAQWVLLSVPSQELVVFTVPSVCFMWNKALLKVACVKTAGICFALWTRHRKRHLELKVEITYSVSDTESKYKLKPCFPLPCISSVCVLVLAATAVFSTNFFLLFLITGITGSNNI